MYLYTITLVLTSLLYLYIFIKRYIHSLFILQLEHYDTSRFVDWFFKNKTNKFIVGPLAISLVALIFIIFLKMEFLVYLELIFGLITLPLMKYKQKKKTLKITHRVQRLIGLSIIIIIIIGVLTYISCRRSFDYKELILVQILMCNFMVYDVIILAHVCGLPIEKRIQRKFINLAQNKILENAHLTTIGITGSYGKTSTKFIVSEVLSKAYNVCVTPNSYNTPMGVTMTINNQLKNIDDYFVCEMGACRVGDIKELTDIAFPKIGIISSIGPQHLETFGNIKNIINTKFELVESLPSEGVAILNYDNYYIRNYYVRNKVKILTYGVEQSNVDYYALNIHYGTHGSTFEVEYPNKERYLFKTKLLGKHNICNILAGIAIGDYLKIPVNKVIYAIQQVNPVPHRLELKNFKNYNVIDDSFNSNIEGATNALDILNHFETKKIIITPGMVELGNSQYELNYKLGEKIAPVCDYVVLVGKKQTMPIQNALTDIQFPVENIFITNSFNEGFKNVMETYKENFTVLIENDLPDNYNEN